MPEHKFIVALARALVIGVRTFDDVMRRAVIVIGNNPRWLAPLVRRYLDNSQYVSARHRDVVRYLKTDPIWDALELKGPFEDDDILQTVSDGMESSTRKYRVASHWLVDPYRMRSLAATVSGLHESHGNIHTKPLPAIESCGALALWLNISIDELDWFADLKALNQPHKSSGLHHYHYTVAQKRSGGVRLIEAPQRRLKDIQRKILTEILDRVPSYYAAAHGFVKGRSVRTFATQHVGKRVVLKLDLTDFFPTISGSRIQSVFRTLGYPEPVADVLGGLCTNAAPRSLFVDRNSRQLYARPHLPQGAPTSPSLANICAYRMDCRLTGLADWAGATYSRYADDLAFSGDDHFARNVDRYAIEVASVALSEGWRVQHHKTRVMRHGVRQTVAGVVVNKRMNVARSEFDTLKATLHNCVRHGLESQNREQHPRFREQLRGRVAWIASINPARGQRLRELLHRIE